MGRGLKQGVHGSTILRRGSEVNTQSEGIECWLSEWELFLHCGHVLLLYYPCLQGNGRESVFVLRH